MNTLSLETAQNITVQILYNGGPLKSEGVRVYFLANDTSIVPAEPGTYALTDVNGMATYTATANKTGNLKLTATAMSMSSGVSASKVFIITSGPVATPSASVTATPSPSATVSATATIAPTTAPTTAPTAEPTVAPTSAPTATPEPATSSAQATGIIVTGFVLAVILLAAVAIAQMLRKK